MKYNCTFIGRKINAIGITYEINDTVEADSIGQARIKLYDNYEHISQFIAIPIK